MKRMMTLAVALLAAGLLFGCKSQNQNDTNPSSGNSAGYSAPTTQPMAMAVAAEEQGKEAVAEIHGAGDNRDKIHGTVTFTQEAGGVKIVADLDGLSPGKHGIHIHEKADLSDPKLAGAGGHFNPGGAAHKHAGPMDKSRHAGDLGNIDADQSGHARLELTDDALSIDGPKNGVVGHSVIVHAKEDDLKGQPAGNSGDRIAGGVIVLKADHKT